MTLEQTTRRILTAVEALDLEGLEGAAKERDHAIAMLDSLPPTPALRNAVAASIAAGEEAKRAIRTIRQRFRRESRRLERIEDGFVRALRPVVHHRVDCRG
ncbi:MAG TPA: hypothetical protein VK752_29115 [Bryobacteraceae bacterium]|jgi:hypothetical protein|nr:hypothetical protein [Bryobacteraceae bacterium]